MSARRFAVPCVHCDRDRDYFLHGAPDIRALTVREVKMHHVYQPAVASPEYAAVKLREALEHVQFSGSAVLKTGANVAACPVCRGPIPGPTTDSYLAACSLGPPGHRDGCALTVALTFADAAGITSEPTP